MKKLTFTLALAVLTLATIAQTSRRQDNSDRNTTNNTNESKNNYKKNSSTTNRDTENYNANYRENRRGNGEANNAQSRQRNDNVRHEQKKSGTDYHAYRYNNHNSRNRDNTVTVTYSNGNRRGNNWDNSRRDAHTQKVYTTPRRRVVIDNEHVRYHRVATHKVYHKHWREPAHINIIWTEKMHHEYRIIYPYVNDWCISYGTHIHTIAAYDAQYHVGEISKVYGKVADVFYSAGTDEYLLFIGDYYPWQDMTIILPGYIARSYSWNPELYFKYEYVSVTGYITSFEDKPEIAVKKNYQLTIY